MQGVHIGARTVAPTRTLPGGAEPPPMVLVVAELAPPLLALTLIALAHDGALHPRRLAQVALAAIALGPIAASLLGFVGWLLMVTLGVAALAAYAAYRRAPGFRLLSRE